MSTVSSVPEGQEPAPESVASDTREQVEGHRLFSRKKGRRKHREPHPGRALDKKNLATRTGTGIILAAVSFTLLWAGVVPFAFLSTVFVVVAIFEFCSLARKSGLRPSRGIAAAAGVVIMGASTFTTEAWLGRIVAVTAVVTMIGAFFRGGPRPTPEKPRYVDSVTTVFAWFYGAWMLCFLVLLRRLEGHVIGPWHVQLDAGIAYVMLFILTIACNDIGCFAVGKSLGVHSLAPHVSPNKTIEGAVGGLLIATVVASVVGWGFGLPPAPTAVYAAVVAVAAQLGDLWESMLKREAGVKDSGRLIAGHGGVLDRFDSYIFAAPVAYILTLLLLPR